MELSQEELWDMLTVRKLTRENVQLTTALKRHDQFRQELARELGCEPDDASVIKAIVELKS